MNKAKYISLYRKKAGNGRYKQPNTVRRVKRIPEHLKPEFDRLEADLAAFYEFVENDQEIKETFDRLEAELKRMELKT